MVVEQPGERSTPRVVAPHHIGIHVTSVDAALPFFVDVLGLELAFRWAPRAPYLGTLLADPEYTMEAAVLRVAGSTFAVELVHFGHVSVQAAEARHAAPGTAHLALAVSDVDAMCRRVREAGFELLSDPVVPTIGPIRGGKVVLVLGPEGVRVELIESPRWLHDTGHLP
ncbi:VOC family protein [Streptomyces sp. JHA26]|uniref:VOC family protein n=1 Tax=Streptomyces sp. JHA26 TaxID=1917143 RepID=UPI00098B97DB|nr:VOC family protein [Streptomyces sp. JHA26]